MGEHEFARDVPPRRACFKCRRVYAGRQRWTHKMPKVSAWRSDRPCSECGGRTLPISHTFEMPRRRNVRAWERLRKRLGISA